MSSLIRRLEIRLMKRAGYTREKWIMVRTPRGDMRPQSVNRDGEITDPDDTPIGRDWPVRVPARARMATSPKRRTNAVEFVPFALRRSKRSQAWLEARAAKRETSNA
jgi:hypothetical protein